jgi:hypothetical protein
VSIRSTSRDKPDGKSRSSSDFAQRADKLLNG